MPSSTIPAVHATAVHGTTSSKAPPGSPLPVALGPLCPALPRGWPRAAGRGSRFVINGRRGDPLTLCRDLSLPSPPPLLTDDRVGHDPWLRMGGCAMGSDPQGLTPIAYPFATPCPFITSVISSRIAGSSMVAGIFQGSP